MKRKVSLVDKNLIQHFMIKIGVMGGIYTYLSVFVDFFQFYEGRKNKFLTQLVILFCVTMGLVAIYIWEWRKANKQTVTRLKINESDLEIKIGNLFEEEGYKVIAFNEYFDTQVDDIIISKRSLNGLFINDRVRISKEELDSYIYAYLDTYKGKIYKLNMERTLGKNRKYPLGTICKYEDYLLTALSKFDQNNRAEITMKDYVSFLMNFWTEVDRVYASNSIVIPLLGSGITRFRDKSDITDQELLEILIWSFRISRIKFNYPSKVSIIIHPDKVDKINFYKLKELV